MIAFVCRWPWTIAAALLSAGAGSLPIAAGRDAWVAAACFTVLGALVGLAAGFDVGYRRAIEDHA